MRVYRPTDNQLTGGYTSTHRAYDFAGLKVPDEVRAGANGVIVERVDAYNTNWRTTSALTTKDYGNYIKIKHDDGSIELHAHLRQGSSFVIGTRVAAGQVVARIGNTGNSTGPHVHSEYRNAQNVNIPVEFYTNESTTVQVPSGKFEELVAKSTKWDEFSKLNLTIEEIKKLKEHTCPPTISRRVELEQIRDIAIKALS